MAAHHSFERSFEVSMGTYQRLRGADFFGFQDAILEATAAPNRSTSNATLQIDLAGCMMDGHRNCTAACYDPHLAPKALWNDAKATHTLANCMIAPILVDIVTSNCGLVLSDDSKFPEVTDFDNFDVLEFLGLRNDSIYGSKGLGWQAINNCTAAFCESDLTNEPPGESCEITGGSFPELKIRDLGGTVWLQTLGFDRRFCDDYADFSVNADIGGIGMVISYMMQIILALLLWAYIRLVSTWIMWASILWSLLSRKATARSLWRSACLLNDDRSITNDAVTKATTLRDRVRASWFSKSVKELLVDFHKTQVFFLMAVQVTLLWAYREGTATAATSYGQASNNKAFFGLLVTCTFFLKSFTWWTIHLSFQDTMFVDIMSYVLNILTTIFFYCASYTPTSNWVANSNNQGLPQCGSIGSTIKYCGRGGMANRDLRCRSRFSWICGGVMTMLLGFNVASRLFLHDYERVRENYRAKTWLRAFMYDLAGLFLECSVAQELFQLFKIYARATRTIGGANSVYAVLDSTEWSLGQVISVTIWAPVLIVFVYRLIRRMIESRETKGKVHDTAATQSGDDIQLQPLSPPRRSTA